MKFEISERIPTNADKEDLLSSLEEQLRKVTERPQLKGFIGKYVRWLKGINTEMSLDEAFRQQEGVDIGIRTGWWVGIGTGAVLRVGDTIFAECIQATFGWWFRKDITTVKLVELKDPDEGFLVVGNVVYRPSWFFWLILYVLLPTVILWPIPCVIYLIHKNFVKNAVEGVFTGIKNEFMSSMEQRSKVKNEFMSSTEQRSKIDQLEKLANLKEKGAVTEEEFQAMKKELLGL